MWIRIHCILLHAAVAVATGTPAVAQEIGVRVNGRPVAFTGMGPVQIEGRVMVPLRGVLEAMGAAVVWDPATRSVVGSKGSNRFELRIDRPTATVDGRTVTLDVPARVMRGATMVPLRFVSEALGADVRWSGSTRTVEIATVPSFGGEGGEPGAPGPATAGGTALKPDGAAGPVIESFRHDATAPLRSGETLTVEMEGTPGGRAAFDLVGVATGVPMTETRPGHYTARMKVPAGLSVGNARVFGRLTVGNRQAPLVQSGTTVAIDAIPPRIVDLTPASGSRVAEARPDIYADYRSEGDSDIDARSVRLRVNGADVTGQARVTPGFIIYTPPADLKGQTTVEVRVADRAGNEQSARSTFTVLPGREGLVSLSHSAEQPLEPGETLTVTLKGEPGGRAVFDIAGTGVGAQGIAMTETSPGTYVGRYVVRPGDRAFNAPVRARFISRATKILRLTAPRTVTLAGGEPVRPTLLSPPPNARLGGTVVVTGRAEPGSTVRIALTTSGRLFGVLPVEGGTVTREVKAGADGLFKTEPISLPDPAGARDLRYQIEVTAIDPLGRSSEPAVGSFRAE